ncbi:MAG TPA: HisA/HisF-related TIM barrel protein [Gemmatimonadaceae bacterium]|nr:HisA/HisF-related TIM barrel protein [Gemmatimonadaceae bacterium]
MRIIGVIDIREGRAVHAVAGARAAYAPAGDGDALALARDYVERLGVREIYVADLDAITLGVDELNASLVGAIAGLGVPVMVDAGVSSVDDAERVLGAGASKVIVGLETLTDFAALDDICARVGGVRVIFSIDLRDGVSLARPNVASSFATIDDVARRVAESGVRTAIVLDLARVGTGAGVDLDIVRSIRAAAPTLTLLAGGGVREQGDLVALAGAGCDGALVATALQRGSIKVAL